jgi:hypothetical protein
MLELITSAYRKIDLHNLANGLPLQSNIGRVFSVFGWGLEIVREHADRVRLWANIDHAKGSVLDRYGKNFGVRRGGANDLFYRLMIKIKVLSQISGGDMETVIGAISGLYEMDPEGVAVDEVFPAKLRITLNHAALPPWYMEVYRLVAALVKRIIAAGVGFELIYLEEGESNGQLHIGGRVGAQYTRIRLATHTGELPEMPGKLYIGGRATAQFSRVRLGNWEG